MLRKPWKPSIGLYWADGKNFELTGETVEHEEVKAWAASLRNSESESA